MQSYALCRRRSLISVKLTCCGRLCRPAVSLSARSSLLATKITGGLLSCCVPFPSMILLLSISRRCPAAVEPLSCESLLLLLASAVLCNDAVGVSAVCLALLFSELLALLSQRLPKTTASSSVQPTYRHTLPSSQHSGDRDLVT